MKTWLVVFTVISVVISVAVPANAIIVEDFNSALDAPVIAKADNDGVGTTLFFVNPTGNDYWGINDPVGTTDDYDGDAEAPPTGVPAFVFPILSGNFFNGEDINSPGGEPYENPLSLTWSNVDISGLTDLVFSGLFAAQENAWDGNHYIKIQYRIDEANASDPYNELLWFSSDEDPIEDDDELAFDADRDGVGDDTNAVDVLTLTAANFSATISGTGSLLDLRILMNSNDNNEAFAFDTLTVVGVPEPSAFLFGGLVCGVFGMTAVRRRLIRKPASNNGN